MDSVKSFKGYSKVDELEEQAFKRKTRKRLIILSVSTVVLLAVIIGVVAGVIMHKRNNSSSSVPNSDPGPELTPAASLKAVCGMTQYPSSCFLSISALETSNSTDPEVIFKLSLQVAIHAAAKLPGLPAKIGRNIFQTPETSCIHHPVNFQSNPRALPPFSATKEHEVSKRG
ncbi:pectinesterase 3-like [Pyrus x bretschneideri]|uniref:pectinesterase 3-like n=1 Tax=Pyrus x bretschneideri TaxID=225117 RepID=UPI00202DDD1E|nr:pectinesterase 3-like [Pyrus x bretschneideri]